MKEIDKVGILCLINILSISIFYLESNMSILRSTLLFGVGLYSVGTITRKYQNYLKNQVKDFKKENIQSVED